MLGAGKCLSDVRRKGRSRPAQIKRAHVDLPFMMSTS
jgi:hypothetical protein